MLGSYLLIVTLDYYIGSSVKYIVINIIRRITLPGFEAAIIDSPYGSKGKVLRPCNRYRFLLYRHLFVCEVIPIKP